MSETRRRWVRALYALIAVGWPLASFAGFWVTLRHDNFAIFNLTYHIAWIVILPGLLMLLTIGLAFTGRAPGHLWRLALCAWIATVAVGHKSLIDIAAASV